MSKIANILWALIAATFMFSCTGAKPHGQPLEPSSNHAIAAVNNINNRPSRLCIPNPNGDSLGTTLKSQETDHWCWAACTQMILQSFGITESQCQIAKCMFGRADCCPPSSMPPECDNGGWPPLACYHLEGDSTVDSAISWDEVKNQIYCRKIAFCFGWTYMDEHGNPAGGHHIMVASGYRKLDGVNQVKMLNPYPPHMGRKRWIDYEDEFKSNPFHSHWNDLYNVRRKAGN